MLSLSYKKNILDYLVYFEHFKTRNPSTEMLNLSVGDLASLCGGK
jgi:hypothetical protein